MRALNDEEQLMATLPDAAATVRLRRFTLVLLALNVLAAIIAIAANLPAQFGGVGTDAGNEFLTGGIGEMAAEPTADTSRAVLTTSGIAWLVVTAVLIALATSAVPRSRRSATAPA
jgi:glucan phosphoethanolaminetransferase (alkaline phosphatase superfamily)